MEVLYKMNTTFSAYNVNALYGLTQLKKKRKKKKEKKNTMRNNFVSLKLFLISRAVHAIKIKNNEVKQSLNMLFHVCSYCHSLRFFRVSGQRRKKISRI